MVRNILLLGSTGSIGRQTLDVARELADRVRVVGLAGYTNVSLLKEQAEEFEPLSVVTTPEGHEALLGIRA